jgi:hypothetical protein
MLIIKYVGGADSFDFCCLSALPTIVSAYSFSKKSSKKKSRIAFQSIFFLENATIKKKLYLVKALKKSTDKLL